MSLADLTDAEKVAFLLDELEREGFIEIRKLDRVTIFITKQGLERAAHVTERAS